MHFISMFIIITSIVFLGGCSGEKESHHNPAPTIDEITASSSKEGKKTPRLHDGNYEITNINGWTLPVQVKLGLLKVSQIDQPIIVVNIFSTKSSPSRGMISYLNDLQNEYKGNIFVIGLPIDGNMDKVQLKEFMQTYDARYFISSAPDNIGLAKNITHYLNLGSNYPVPATVVFRNGQHVSDYIGATPIEMIRGDIDQLIQ